MNVIIGSDKEGFALKEKIKEMISSDVSLKEKGFKVIDVTIQPEKDFIESVKKIVQEIRKDSTNLGIAFDGFGAGSFMAATKHKGIIAAEVSDERSAYMTRGHNNARIITIGSQIVGDELAKNIVKEFLQGNYEGGRHQVRVDMLNKMA